jgi:hypothetical protein
VRLSCLPGHSVPHGGRVMPGSSGVARSSPWLDVSESVGSGLAKAPIATLSSARSSPSVPTTWSSGSARQGGDNEGRLGQFSMLSIGTPKSPTNVVFDCPRSRPRRCRWRRRQAVPQAVPRRPDRSRRCGSGNRGQWRRSRRRPPCLAPPAVGLERERRAHVVVIGRGPRGGIARRLRPRVLVPEQPQLNAPAELTAEGIGAPDAGLLPWLEVVGGLRRPHTVNGSCAWSRRCVAIGRWLDVSGCVELAV